MLVLCFWLKGNSLFIYSCVMNNILLWKFVLFVVKFIWKDEFWNNIREEWVYINLFYLFDFS